MDSSKEENYGKYAKDSVFLPHQSDNWDRLKNLLMVLRTPNFVSTFERLRNHLHEEEEVRYKFTRNFNEMLDGSEQERLFGELIPFVAERALEVEELFVDEFDFLLPFSSSSLTLSRRQV